MAIVAGPYHVVEERHGGVGMALYCRESLAQYLDADEIFTVTRQGLDFFEAEFGYPYPFEKYDQLFVPEFNFGAMENPGCITFNEGYIFRSRVTDAAFENRAGTILHEMAHMWFGDLVTMRWWDDLWLNESFATYMGNDAVARATRFSDAWVRFAVGHQGLGAGPGPAADHPSDLGRHRRHRRRPPPLRRHHLRQGRVGPEAAGGVGGQATPSPRASGGTSAATSGPTPASPTSSAPWRRPAAGISRPGPRSGSRRPA